MNEIQFQGQKFLNDIEKAETVSKKFKLLNAVLDQEVLIKKSFKEQIAKNRGKSNDYEYIPIGIIEKGLREVFFHQVDFIIKSNYRELNSYVIVASIQYKCPISHEKRTIDGIGAKAIQQDKDSLISEFNSTMKVNGIEIAVGIAYSRAIKNAAKKLGKVFGGDLNRDDEGENYFYNTNILN